MSSTRSGKCYTENDQYVKRKRSRKKDIDLKICHNNDNTRQVVSLSKVSDINCAVQKDQSEECISLSQTEPFDFLYYIEDTDNCCKVDEIILLKDASDGFFEYDDTETLADNFEPSWHQGMLNIVIYSE